MVEAGQAIACTGRRDFGADGDAYLVYVDAGTVAFVRNTQWVEGRPADYVQLPPGVSDAWVLAERRFERALVPVRVSDTVYRLMDIGGTKVYARIHVDPADNSVHLVASGMHQSVDRRRMISWREVRVA